MKNSSRFNNYYSLTKSGLVFGNIITVIGGLILAVHVFRVPLTWHLLVLFVATIVGIALVMASGCVLNNYIDRDIDRFMERTKDRVIVTGHTAPDDVLVFGGVLGFLGFIILLVFANITTFLVAALGFFFYVVMYSMWWKRRSPWGTFVGAISGAVPPVVGYAAVSARIDDAAIILFAIMVVWQMPHFFAIGIRRAKDYAAAGVPILPVKRGIRVTKISMLLYIIAFALIAPLLTVFGYLGYMYFSIVTGLSIAWIILAARGFSHLPSHDDIRWARTMFFFSLIVMMATFITIAVVSVLS